ncbi:hypothetical protein SH1V18_33320 [Vallitalea longa]|uniref:DUF2992 family protein n=1 Tax=Vallitalea longa TaxID=2936439 RepID=A0A9W5YCA8_9FIRM|nr:YjdF family protein [Vallitalea longa]GKX30852.1 hypothetical protein SH1V18_33320 [Vallitalea longa]
MKIDLTVLFDGTFWIGIFEEYYDDSYCVYKHLFGTEPKDYQIYKLILKEFDKLRFTHQIQDNLYPNKHKKLNYKKMQKMIKKEVNNTGIGTKAQRAISMNRELNKMESKKKRKINKEQITKLNYEKKQQKKKQKKRGH